jgi:hypothetical protein
MSESVCGSSFFDAARRCLAVMDDAAVVELWLAADRAERDRFNQIVGRMRQNNGVTDPSEYRLLSGKRLVEASRAEVFEEDEARLAIQRIAEIMIAYERAGGRVER